MTVITEPVTVTRSDVRRPVSWEKIGDHAVLILGSLLMIMPVFAAFMTIGASDVEISRHGMQISDGAHMIENFDKALFERGGFTGSITGGTMLLNSFILGIGFAVGKIILGMIAAYAIVYFRLRFATFAFWMIFTTLLLPLEVRILPTYEVVHGMGLINTYTGLIVPLVASATATFFFRQFFLSVPEELVEAARIDGAGPVKFLHRHPGADLAHHDCRHLHHHVRLWLEPVSLAHPHPPPMRPCSPWSAASSRSSRASMVVRTFPSSAARSALAFIAILPPVMVVVVFQSWFVKGLV